MALKLVVDKLEDVPEAFRGEYKERNGKFHLDADYEDVTRRKNTGTATREEKRKREERLKQYEGLDPAKAREALEAAQKAEEDRAKKAGEFETLKGQMAERHAAEKKALEQKG